MVANIAALSGAAADKFGLMATAAGSLTSSTSETIVAMRESAAYTSALLDKVVAQNAMLAGRQEDGAQRYCRSGTGSTWETHFTVSRYGWGLNKVRGRAVKGKLKCWRSCAGLTKTGSSLLLPTSCVPAAHRCSDSAKATHPAAGRRLLADGGGAADYSSADQLQQWEGYTVAVGARYNSSGWNAHNAAERARYAGVRGNRVVGGLFLHTTRRVAAPACEVGSTAARYHPDCTRGQGVGAGSQLAAYLTALFKGGWQGVKTTGVLHEGHEVAAAGGQASWRWKVMHWGGWGLGAGTGATCRSKLICALVHPTGGSDEASPYGTDPVFMPSSPLYDPALVGAEGDFCNTTSLQEVNARGAPYAFFSRQLAVSRHGVLRRPFAPHVPFQAHSPIHKQATTSNPSITPLSAVRSLPSPGLSCWIPRTAAQSPVSCACGAVCATADGRQLPRQAHTGGAEQGTRHGGVGTGRAV